MSEFTKGPWHLNTTVFDGEPVGWEVVGTQEGSSNAIIVGMLKCSPSKSISKNIKDAQLIAAAPDMLEALKAILKSWDGPLYRHEMGPNIDLARKAVAKVGGLNNAA